MAARILDPIDVKRPEWREITESVLQRGNVRHLRGVVPEGCQPGGRWEYRKRVNVGRIYLCYITGESGGQKSKMTVIASVDPEHANICVAWKPKPYTTRLFNFESGMVKVIYDELALPCHIVAMRQP